MCLTMHSRGRTLRVMLLAPLYKDAEAQKG